MREAFDEFKIVSIHAPTRGATKFLQHYGHSVLFQSTLPRGERRSPRRCTYHPPRSFNPRSHEGSDIQVLSSVLNSHSFNPRSHEGSDLGGFFHRVGSIVVSIHAPTRGATRYITFPTVDLSVSIHAPTRGATQGDIDFVGSVDVSIHAPTRGATFCNGEILSPAPLFQSTLPRGERPSAFSAIRVLRSFNPRSHEGSDSALRLQVWEADCFNPRSHEGSDAAFSISDS